MTEPVPMRADQLSVGDLVPDAYLPHRFNKGPAEVRFVAPDGEGHTFFAFRYPNGQHDSTTVLSVSALEIWPGAPVGHGYSRADDGEVTQPIAGRLPAHLEDGRTGEVFEVPSGSQVRPDPTGLDEVSDADLRETVHFRTGGLIVDFGLACGAEGGPNTRYWEKVTCSACLDKAPV